MSTRRITRTVGGRVVVMRPKKKELPARLCACGCQRRFIPKDPRQLYYEVACKNREGQKNLRARARIGA